MRLALTRLLLATAVSCWAMSPARADDWKQYQPEGGFYSVALPSSPVLDTRPGTTDSGRSFIYHTATSTDPVSGLRVSVGYVDLPTGTRYIPENYAEGIVKDMGAFLRSQLNVTFAGSPAIQLIMRTAGDSGKAYEVKAVLLSASSRLYQLYAFCPLPVTAVCAGSQPSFFNTFRITGAPR